jgi:phage-related protein
MTQQYRYFVFDNQLYDQLFNVTLSNDFYIACLRGSRSIKEEKIPGRDIPYFFEVDDEPVEFDVNFALINPLTMTQIKAITRGLIARTGYKNLHFGEVSGNIYTRKTPIFNVVFTNEPDFHFMGAGKNSSNIDTYVGYFTLHVRADRPYGFESIIIKFELDGTITNAAGPTIEGYTATVTGLAENHTFQVGDTLVATNSGGTFGSGTAIVTLVGATTMNVRAPAAFANGNITNIKLSTYTVAGPTGGTFAIDTDISIAPGISFKKIGASTNPIRLRNVTNGSAVSFTGLAANERVTISASLKTITSIGGASSIYTRWDKNELILDNGSNQLVFEEYTAGNQVPWGTISSNIIENYTISLEAPSFLKGD